MYYLKKEQAILGKRILQDVSSETEAVSVLDELEQVESLLKIAGCVKIELIPGTETNLDKKKFNWSLE